MYSQKLNLLCIPILWDMVSIGELSAEKCKTYIIMHMGGGGGGGGDVTIWRYIVAGIF